MKKSTWLARLAGPARVAETPSPAVGCPGPLALLLLAAFVAATTLVIAPRAALAAPTYTVTELPPLPGYTDGWYAEDVNASGQVVGGSYDPNLDGRAVLWENGQPTDLGMLPGTSGSTASAINDYEQIVGVSGNSAFLWESGQMTDLNDLIPADSNVTLESAEDINNAGQIVATSADNGTYVYDNGQLTALDPLPGYTSAGPNAINEWGHVVGYSSKTVEIDPGFPETRHRATLWMDGQVIDLGVDTDNDSNAVDINSSGQVVGNYLTGLGVVDEAFLWDNGRTSLPTFGGTGSTVSAINDAGQAVGVSETSGGAGRAALWEGGQITDLNDRLPADSGVTLRRARGITDGGHIIAQTTDFNEVLLTPAEPSGADLSVGGVESPTPAEVGRNLTYSLSVDNNGPATATNAILEDTLPANAEFVSASVNDDNTKCQQASGQVSCALGDLLQYDFADVEIVVRPTAEGTLANTVTVSSDAEDPDAANNEKAFQTEVSPAQAPLIAGAIARDSSFVTGASFVELPPKGRPNAASETPLLGVPVHGPGYGVLTTGSAARATDPSVEEGDDNGGGNVRGDTDYDVSILKVDLAVPEGSSCLAMDFKFLSEEYPNFVGDAYNDAFIAELDDSTWTTSGSAINAPNNFAVDENDELVSINSTGYTGMTADRAAGTIYGGATRILTAQTPITPGTHSLYLSIFDQGDEILDSAAFMDNLGLTAESGADCKSGIELPEADLSLDKSDSGPVPAGSDLTYTLTASNSGPEPATNVVVEDTLPANVEFVSATADSGGSCENNAGTVKCAFSNLAANGQPATAAIVVRPTLAAAPEVSNTATVSGAVNDTNQPNNSDTVTTAVSDGSNQLPVAGDDFYDAEEDAPLTVGDLEGVLANDTDAEGDPLSAVLVEGPANGALDLNPNGSFSYTPEPNSNGSDSFTYKASDGTSESNVATVQISVNPVDDRPVANDDAYETNEDAPLSARVLEDLDEGVLANDEEFDGDPLTARLIEGPANGTLTFNADGSFDYNPQANFHGSDSFKYAASDGTIESEAAVVSITVNPVNDKPQAKNDAYATNEDTPLTVGALAGVLVNDTDAEGAPLSAVLVEGPANGALDLNPNGSFSYTPKPNSNGLNSFTYSVSDGQESSDLATVNINVKPINDKPVAKNDTGETDQDIPVDVNVLANDTDADGDALTVSGASGAVHGTLSINADKTVRYVPAAGYVGPDSFTYTVSDGKGGTATATVSMQVLDTRKPEILSVSPANGAKAVGATDNVEVVFSEKMAPASINGTTFFLKKGTTKVSASVALDAAGLKAILNPTNALVKGATYTATVTTGAKDLTGNNLLAGKTWSFSVNSPPSITGVSPTGTIANTAPQIKATIKDAQSKLLKSNIKLLLDGKARTTFTYDSTSGALLFNSPKLAKGTHSVKIVATDPQGLKATKLWSFTIS